MTADAPSETQTPAVSRASIQATIAAAHDAVKAAKVFQRRITDLASAATDLASAIDTLRQSSERVEPAAGSLRAAADLHRSIATQHASLADHVHNQFELPLLRQLSAHAKHIDDADKQRMLREGEWRATKAGKGIASFHISELYSPWVTWPDRE